LIYQQKTTKNTKKPNIKFVEFLKFIVFFKDSGKQPFSNRDAVASGEGAL
jgi:hypothetical protein